MADRKTHAYGADVYLPEDRVEIMCGCADLERELTNILDSISHIVITIEFEILRS